ncbi:hypothetical protein [Salsuginibacillus kocurii]|uniref:hypothetical protein n=1 Tax=Salsuginibacillus kocurii TaxID=427078 RepID=UPI0012EADD4A|nr:hypothetical protein [Salsuginibacillus kocurii]
MSDTIGEVKGLFNGNKLVVILPIFLMAFMFFGGWFYLQQSDVISNEDLYEHVELEAQLEENSTQQLDVSWEWRETPEEGLVGEDYIGISVIDEDEQPLLSEEIEEASLQLFDGEDVIYETEGEEVENGIIFSFPNELEENVTYGNEGHINMTITGSAESASVSYLHTWVEHDGLESEDARFFSPSFAGQDEENVSWVIERFVEAGEVSGGQGTGTP